MFDRLGVFVGSFDQQAAAAVAANNERRRVGGTRRAPSLVAKSMVLDDEGVGGTTRYQLLETLRHFARDRLDAAGETDVWRRRHAEYYRGSPRRSVRR